MHDSTSRVGVYSWAPVHGPFNKAHLLGSPQWSSVVICCHIVLSAMFHDNPTVSTHPSSESTHSVDRFTLSPCAVESSSTN